jgi:hypothetical protein
MITPHATRHVIARDGCLLRVDVAAADQSAAAAQPVLLSQSESAERLAAISRDVKRGATLSRNMSNRANGTRFSGADVTVYRVARVTLG